MTSLKSFNRRVGSLFAVAALVLATVTPGLVPTFASAAQVTERFVELSNSSKEMPGVSYKIGFTTVGAAKAVVLDFCNDSPLVGAACSAPAGFSVATATTPVAGGFTKSTGTAADGNTAVLVGDMAASTATEVVLENVTNPSNPGPLYVRIVTYTGADATEAETNANGYVSDQPLGTGNVDSGSAAASITDTVGVSAAVLESMIFCVSGEIANVENCKKTPTAEDPEGDDLAAPVVRLGEGSGDIRALDAQHVSEGSIYSQISTNAANGAIVSLKSSNDCGGLKRASVTTCDIVATEDGITAGQAKFGVKVEAATDPGTGSNSTGVYQIFGTSVASAWYSTSMFKLKYDNTKATGVTSTYGDKLLDTGSAPVNNKNVKITFGASAANNTPAGLYATDLSLIATGKF